MILKASQRGGGQDLAAHLMKMDDNEHLSVHELRGFASDNLRDAFREVEAISKGTKCRQYLFSLSLSPPADARVSVDDFEKAIGRIEKHLALEDQPRAIVFHEKEGRRHAHAVWSRIDADTMTAKQMSFFKQKLMGVSRELYLEHGWKLPRGLERASERNPTNFTLAEWQQAKRQGIDPRWLKSTLQDCWQRSDNSSSFERSISERGFFLARGDKRSFVILDHQGEVWSLPRMLDLKTNEVRQRLGEGDHLKSVDETKEIIGQRMTPALRRHIEESKKSFAKRSAELNAAKSAMTQAHRTERAALSTRQAVQWETETRERAARLPMGLRGLWHRITGQYRDVRRANEHEAEQSRQRQTHERQSLIDAQREQRAALQMDFKELRSAQAKQLLELRGDIGRFFKFTRNHQTQDQSRRRSIGLRLERS
ncbi:relaxase [Devosia sp. YIM 151766]|uniref:relaxase/mobilization nuclease domain-containing protein n=1 Tax=Devosia sp. YIM 151766 TaxID=3017325 RepID=UPI00255D093D|nr:relaxase/mobilization nuclease domain-containing protein [Devosia sp. YIM 151766]WIY52164.1 relaxase [Devosia sp. YIM 151766]